LVTISFIDEQITEDQSVKFYNLKSINFGYYANIFKTI
jgi:hypothetical protein